MPNENHQFRLGPQSNTANFECDIGEEGTSVSGDSSWFDWHRDRKHAAAEGHRSGKPLSRVRSVETF